MEQWSRFISKAEARIRLKENTARSTRNKTVCEGTWVEVRKGASSAFGPLFTTSELISYSQPRHVLLLHRSMGHDKTEIVRHGRLLQKDSEQVFLVYLPKSIS